MNRAGVMARTGLPYRNSRKEQGMDQAKRALYGMQEESVDGSYRQEERLRRMPAAISFFVPV